MPSGEVKLRSYQEKVFKLIESIAGANMVIAVPTLLLKFAGSVGAGFFLAQLLYWSDKGSSRDGYIFKTYKEWHNEILISEYHIRAASKKFKKMGFLETKVKKAWGRPTVYYKLNRAALEKALLEYLVIESEKIKSRSGENADSLTEITSEITYRENNGALSSERHEAISLDKYLKTSRKAGLQVDEEAVECIRYFLEQYESQRMEAHPRLRYGQWETYVDTVLSCTDSFGHIHHFTSDELKLMIDDYFKTGFEPGCDYRLMHFNTDGVKAVRMYQAA